MTTTDSFLIDKQLVHKRDEKNVFLLNLRRYYANFYEKKFFESILNKMKPFDLRLILSFYTLMDNHTLHFLDADRKYYKLKSIIPEISNREMKKLDQDLCETEKEFLFTLYKQQKDSPVYQLVRDVSEEEEKKILTILKKRDQYVTSCEKTQISTIFDTIDDVPKGDIFYANMHINLAHDFFFEHPNEHIPGIMILETFRQFVVAVNHVFGKVPIKTAQLVLECLESKYYKYAELIYPITLKGKIQESRWNKHGYWSKLDIVATVIQNDSEVAFFRLYGQIITKRLFLRIRRGQMKKFINNFRFLTLPDFTNHYAIKQQGKKEFINVQLDNISSNGFKLKSDYFTIENKEENQYDFVLYFHDIGFIHGLCEKRWLDIENKQAGFKIIEISKEDNDNLQESIIKYCYVDEKREMF